MSAWSDIGPAGHAASVRPAGHAATAAEFLDEAAADSDQQDVAVRQLAALQGIGWALLAVGEHLADETDATATVGDHLADVAAAVEDLHRERLPRLHVRRVLARLLPESRGGDRA